MIKLGWEIADEVKHEIGNTIDTEFVLKSDYDKLRKALNRIVLLGAGATAYTKDFTTEVNGIARGALEDT